MTSKALMSKLLIANRGEIACRIMNTAKRLGVRTVAVHSEPDVDALHVRMADEAVCLGGASSRESYLSIDRLTDAIRMTGAKAVHPGYGFLSENSEFAHAVEDAGAIFVGPNSGAIEAMGDKIQSKQIAIDAGVNTIPGYQGVIKDDVEALKIAKQIGFPVMIKASAGGGGKGMRVAFDEESVKTGFMLATEEARSSFGDDRIFIEKFVENPHHIEIQLLADNFGNVVPFPERECSVQRRNQKVLEESPSVLLDEATRTAMGQQAVMLAKAVGYRSAGTVEFLCDNDRNFYFLEMNTRLQVEHPVTELVTGVDLVEEMLQIAVGNPLRDEWTKENAVVPINGWAIEARVYAEDPFRSFLPSTGPLVAYREPPAPARVDSGVVEGTAISMYYDPMISKLVTHGSDRMEALAKMRTALNEYVVDGVRHNIPFLSDVCRHPKFETGEASTNFIADEYPDGFAGVQLTLEEDRLAAAASVVMHASRPRLQSAHVSQDCDEVVVTLRDGVSMTAQVVRQPESGDNDWRVTLCPVLDAGGAGESAGEKSVHELKSVAWRAGESLFRATVNGEPLCVQHLARHTAGHRISFQGALLDVTVRTPATQRLARHMLPLEQLDTSRLLLCPMPGQLVSLYVNEGDTVEEGQAVAVIEAMKMQNVLVSPRAGVVTEILGAPGGSLKVDEVIMRFT